MSAPEQINSKSPIHCPKCDKLFRLPEGFTVANALACPHCQQQITGQEILDSLAPTATMVGVPVASASPTGEPAPVISDARPTRSFDDQDFVIPKPLKTATRRSRNRRPERKSGSGKSSPESGRSQSGASRSSSKKRSRNSFKKETSTVNELIKIALGGLLALPIAQLILWWGFNSDPLGLASPASNVASFIVPPRLRPGEVVEDEDPEGNKDMPESQEMHDTRVPKTITPG